MVGFATIGKIIHFVENVLNNILIQKVQIILVAFGQFANKLSGKSSKLSHFAKVYKKFIASGLFAKSFSGISVKLKQPLNESSKFVTS